MHLDVLNPYDQSLVARLDYDEGAVLEAKVATTHAAFRRWREVPLAERIEQVRGALERLRGASQRLAVDVSRQMGKPIAQSRGEVDTVFARAEHMLSIAPEVLATDVLPEMAGCDRRIEHVPLGVVLNLAAWNYPLIIPVNVIVPALVAGNSVLLKHSARTPLCGEAFEQAFSDLEIPGLVTSLVLSHEATARLIADRRVAHVAFTGSVEGGSEVYRQVAGRLIDVGLELGGKDPAYVAADADLAFAIAGTVDGACYNAGQSCCAVERVYVHKSLLDDYLGGAQEALQAYRLGDPMDETTTLGPLASRGALGFLEGQVEEATRRGARLLTGGTRVAGEDGNFFAPTLLAGVANTAAVMQEESFGPLLPVLGVDSDEEALAHMGDTRFGLTASIWTADRDRAERFARELDAGTVYQNRCDFLDPALPWTGVGDSGKGSTLSRYGYYHLTRPKSLNFRIETTF
jgi:acyl-CoA reductase-like NAD-dependent aldehyde dehydrogenase